MNFLLDEKLEHPYKKITLHRDTQNKDKYYIETEYGWRNEYLVTKQLEKFIFYRLNEGTTIEIVNYKISN